MAATAAASSPITRNDVPSKDSFISAALTPPTSEDNDIKLELGSRASSVLSDLPAQHDIPVKEEAEAEEEEEIVPDHYYGGGKIPVFKPTMKQFRSFKDYVEKIDKYGMKAGIVKVIPPPEWRESLPKLDDLVKTIKIKNPITQEFMGTHGTYTQANIEKQRSYNLPEWKTLTEEPSHQPPARRGERRRGQEKVVRGGGNLRGRKATTTAPTEQVAPPPTKRQRGRPRRNPLPTPAPVEEDEDDANSAGKSVRASVEKAAPAPKAKRQRTQGPKGDTQKSVSSRRMNNQTETADIIDEAAFEGFDFRMDGLDEFTAERCQELETAYWKSLTFAQPMYAADMPGSLFNESVTSWNVARLENLLDVLGTKVPGVNTAYLYMGMWKATFAWHLEDVDLYSINYIHFGAPKQWYSISQEDARRFEKAMRSLWPNDSKNCDQFLRHKTYLISPQLLKEKFNIEVNRLVHHEGEFVITYPYGYHSGYNLGYNCAESVNFALESWLDFGRIARKCECEADSVWVDVNEIERKLRGEPTPEYYEETDDDDDDDRGEAADLPTPPASVKGKSSKKRKRDSKDKGDEEKKKKRIRIRIKTGAREPCALCPNDAAYESLLPTDNGKKVHRSCALYTPETYLSVVDGVETVLGVAGIDKARLDLKCNFCRSKRGSCFQCASKKCTRAFHATCALAAGVQIDKGPVPTFGEDGTEYYEEGYDLRCKYHRAKRPKNLDPESLETTKLINNHAKRLRPQDVVQAQHLGAEPFAGLVVENRPSEATVLVDVLPDGDRVEVEWKWLLVMRAEDSLRPKPSATALPVPPDMNKQMVSIGNRQDGVPKIDDMFHDNESNKWAEFTSVAAPPPGYRAGLIRNGDQTNVDLNKADQMYYYLGSLSTEVKSKFSADADGKSPAASADFLERVRPAASAVVKPKAPRPAVSKPATSSYVASVPRQPTGSAAVALMYPGASNAQPGHYRTPSGNFPPGAYYSSTSLPASFASYSQYTNHVRQVSGDLNHAQPRASAHYPVIAPRPSPYSHSHPNLQHWGGLQPAAEVQPGLQKLANPHTPGSAEDDGFPMNSGLRALENNVEWTPPSQIYHSHGLDRNPAPQEVRPSALIYDMHQQLAAQTQSQYAQQQPAGNPYAHTGYIPARLPTYKPFAFSGGALPTESPKQPTPSPLSDRDLME